MTLFKFYSISQRAAALRLLTCFSHVDSRAVTGASMNPARSLGPAIVSNHYKGIWIYLLSPTLGAISGAWVYNSIRLSDKPAREITRSGSFLRNASRNRSSTA